LVVSFVICIFFCALSHGFLMCRRRAKVNAQDTIYGQAFKRLEEGGTKVML